MDHARLDASRTSASDPRLVVFNHIPKCGGSTLAEILRKAITAYVPVNHEGDMLRAAGKIDESDADSVLTSGHFVWGIEGLLQQKRQACYITVLRNPESLFKSFYNYQVKRYNTTLGSADYLRTYYSHNPLTEHLAAGNLELAKERLQHEYAAFGILKHFDQSLALFSKRLGLRFGDYQTTNVSGSRQLPLAKETARLFQKMNGLDIALFAWAEAWFQREVSRVTVAVSAVSAAAPAPKEMATSEVPYQESATALIQAGRFKEAIAVIEKHGITLDGLTLADLYRKAGDIAGFRRTAYKQLSLNRISRMQLGAGFAPHLPDLAFRILTKEIKRYGAKPGTVRDSFVNRYLVDCHLQLGLLLWERKNDLPGAEAAFQAALRLGLSRAKAALAYGRFLLRTGRPGQALELLKSVNRHHCMAIMTCRKLELMGECHASLGMLRRARSCYKAWHRLMPDQRSLERYMSTLMALEDFPTLLGFLGDVSGASGGAAVDAACGKAAHHPSWFDPEMFTVWHVALVVNSLSRKDAAMYAVSRQALVLFCRRHRPVLAQVSEGLFSALVVSILSAGSNMDLNATLHVMLQPLPREKKIRYLLHAGRTCLLKEKIDPAVALFKAARGIDPSCSRDVIAIARGVKEAGNPGLSVALLSSFQTVVARDDAKRCQ